MADFTTQRSVLIVFTEPHLAYSPTTLNLFYTLKENYKVKLLSVKPSAAFSDNVVVDPDIEYIELKRDISNVFKDIFYRVFDLLIKPSENTLSLRSLFNNKTKAIISHIKKADADIIAVDSLALWCAQQANKKADLLSLEIAQNENYLKHTRFNTIKSVIIQSEERLNYLFPDTKPRYFIVQNAPRNTNFLPPYGERKKTDLIYCGSAVSEFGIISCLDFIKDNSKYTLTVKGAFPKETEHVINEFYSDLLAEKRLIIDSAYLTESELTNYVSKFRIGLAFYDFYRFAYLRTFNYFTAPSGKVFQYLNSGVPVIANVLPGFQFIQENNCGKLIGHLSSQQIKLAINAIEDDYITIAQNAKTLSAKYDFTKMIQPFLAYFKNESNSYQA
jgi:hypothetical protein